MTLENIPKYPTINIGQCPNCGSTRRLSNEVLQQQILDGKLPHDSQVFIFQHQSIIAGPVGTWLSAPMIISFYDVCVDCGMVYCFHAEVKTAVQGMQNLPGKKRGGNGDIISAN